MLNGYEGIYQISNQARIRSLDREVQYRTSKRFIKGKIMKPKKDKDGYLIIILYKNGKDKTYKMHRLVAQAFIPNPNNQPYINHKDEDKQNNLPENLEWCSAQYNYNYGTCKWRSGAKRKKPIVQYDLNGNKIKEFSGVVDAIKATGHKHIPQALKNKGWTAGGFIWKFK